MPRVAVKPTLRQHCDGCGQFLGNPLTVDGLICVENMIRDYLTTKKVSGAPTDAVIEWAAGCWTLSRQSRNQRGDGIVRRCQSCREPDDGVADGAL